MIDLSTARKKMDLALKVITVQLLRDSGFKGKYPHFYRIKKESIELLSFQFNKWGGSFVVEISYTDNQHKNLYSYTNKLPSELRVSQTIERLRLGPKVKGDYWFRFDNINLLFWNNKYNAIAEKVNYYITTEAETWWENKS